mgnify:FL=1
MDDKHSRTSRSRNSSLAREDQSQGQLELGYITLLVLVLFAVLSAYGLEMYVKAHSENKIARLEAGSRQAFYAAEGGIEWVKMKLQEDPDYTGETVQIGKGTVNVSVLAHEKGYTVTSFAQYGFAKCRLKVELAKVQDQWVITKYQEIY